MLSRRLFCFAAPALILTPGILMPLKTQYIKYKLINFKFKPVISSNTLLWDHTWEFVYINYCGPDVRTFELIKSEHVKNQLSR